jgi:hypothetical protein
LEIARFLVKSRQGVYMSFAFYQSQEKKIGLRSPFSLKPENNGVNSHDSLFLQATSNFKWLKLWRNYSSLPPLIND